MAHYNHHRPHEGIALFTPANLFLGEVEQVLGVRQLALDAHHARHPERHVQGRPQVTRPPAQVWINPDLALPADQLLETAGALKSGQTPVVTDLPEIVS